MDFLLRKNGFEVFQARDGRSWIARAREIQPDLVLLDIQLPQMDGYSVAAELRADSSFCAPIVAVTSHAMVSDKEKAIQAGCTGYIEKPINPDTFIFEIGDHLQKNQENGEGSDESSRRG